MSLKPLSGLLYILCAPKLRQWLQLWSIISTSQGQLCIFISNVPKAEKRNTQTLLKKKKQSTESKSLCAPQPALSPYSLRGGQRSAQGNYCNQNASICPERCACVHSSVSVCVGFFFVRRPLYCNKENSLVDICLETQDKSDSVHRCFNLSLFLASVRAVFLSSAV